ncbi:MAG: hypothetical protein ACPIOQ_17185 [Promethearchaeia archaeon]
MAGSLLQFDFDPRTACLSLSIAPPATSNRSISQAASLVYTAEDHYYPEGYDVQVVLLPSLVSRSCGSHRMR